MIIANWKSNGGLMMIQDWTSDFISSCSPKDFYVGIAPPAIYISDFSLLEWDLDTLEEKSNNKICDIKIGAQDVDHSSGSRTGALAIKMFEDFGIDFEIEQQENSPVALQNLFNKEIQNIDSVLFDYYKKISEDFDSYYFVLKTSQKGNSNIVGYARIIEADFYWNVYELFIKDNFRELGLGTKLFEYIADNANMKNLEVRSFALPSDRQAKNFYESNAITAKVLIMEKKRENNRYRP